MSTLGGWNVDSDGFLVNDNPASPSVIAPPQSVAIPKFFDGCRDEQEATVRMIDELSKPYSYELEGHDVAYRRLANALILLLASRAGFMP